VNKNNNAWKRAAEKQIIRMGMEIFNVLSKNGRKPV